VALARHVTAQGTLAVARATHPGRYVALVLGDKGVVTGVAKVATDERGRPLLDQEAERLAEFGPLLPHPLSAPKVLERQPGTLVFEPVPWRPRRRPWKLSPEVAFALGGFFRGRSTKLRSEAGAIHGDVAPWNLLKTHDGWVVVDWEEARVDGAPFHDVCHHLVQSSALIGRPTGRQILSGLRGKGWVGETLRAHAAGAGVPASRATECLITYLRSSLERLDPDTDDGRRGIKTRLALLRALRPGEGSP
jgi:hypothetical protein